MTADPGRPVPPHGSGPTDVIRPRGDGWLQKLVCNLFGHGGHVKRDPLGRINWQCAKCGRWSDPVDPEVERRVVDRELEADRTRLLADAKGAQGGETEKETRT